MNTSTPVDKARAALALIPDKQVYGSVTKILGLLVEIEGFGSDLSVGSIVHIFPANASSEQGSIASGQGAHAQSQNSYYSNGAIPCEVVGFRDARALLMPFGTLDGIGLGCKAVMQDTAPFVLPDESWLGRVVNALGQPIDGKGPLKDGSIPIPLRNTPPPPHARTRMGAQLDLGVRCVNSFLATCQGQRMGIFSGSGVGKSVLLSMMARYTAADVSVIGLVGERGREVQEFLEDDLGADGLARSVVIVATGDEPALMRRQAAYLTLSVSEYFRDQGQKVLCLIDSVTRFAMAQREIGLSAGEPPTSKGYPPTTFGELARLLERAGPADKNIAGGRGSITGLFSVLVEGDDHNEPISDAVRGIIDGHIVMEREIADRGRYPAINILKSVSRSMPAALTESQNAVIRRAKQIVTTYENMAELIRLGAYRRGSDASVDEAIDIYPQIEEFLRQDKGDNTPIEVGFERLAVIVGAEYP